VRNALTPIITVTGLQLASLLGGSILIETIFTIPGMGQYLFDAVSSRNYPVV
jgi:peptide/nickel transport system permease protein